MGKRTHGHARRRGQRTIPEYRAWINIRQRCLNPDAPNYGAYGGRGISLCERWDSFGAFLEDVGGRPSPAHSIDRIDNDGDYEPGNVRWATAQEQQRNKGTARISFHGEALLPIEWAERTGLSRFLIARRIRTGWSVEAALTTPPQRRGGRPPSQVVP